MGTQTTVRVWQGASHRAIPMLHITNGDSAASGIRETGLAGEVLSWIDVLHEGPVPPDLDLEELRRVRAKFIASCGWATFEEAVESVLTSAIKVLAESLGQDEVVLWFEHDLYDQLQLIQILDWFAHQKLGRTKLTMICAAEYLGSSTVERLRDRSQSASPCLKLNWSWRGQPGPRSAHQTRPI